MVFELSLELLPGGKQPGFHGLVGQLQNLANLVITALGEITQYQHFSKILFNFHQCRLYLIGGLRRRHLILWSRRVGCRCFSHRLEALAAFKLVDRFIEPDPIYPTKKPELRVKPVNVLEGFQKGSLGDIRCFIGISQHAINCVVNGLLILIYQRAQSLPVALLTLRDQCILLVPMHNYAAGPEKLVVFRIFFIIEYAVSASMA